MECRNKTLGQPREILHSDIIPAVAFEYDAYGRFSSVTSSVDTVSLMANYMRLSGSDLIAGYTQGDFTRSVNYESNHDFIASVANHFDTTLISSFDYQNNAKGQRILRIHSGTVTNSFDYNSRQEVKAATMGSNNYGYGYDTIGNRAWSSHNLVTNFYTANNLNQYTAISEPQSELQYDPDGNMAFDGSEWHYSWNGENRLVCASNDIYVVRYAYDHQGRMVWKRIVATGTPTETTSYLWDDYNIISEATAANGTTNTTYNIWGLDLSGSLQGAGGVGGLLAVVNDNTAFLPCYDGNGNITEYVTTNGTIAAHYKYSPFGENTAHSGSLVDAFTHRFSTKPWCPITNLCEYELRKYRPDIGRWINRDPIGEQGEANLYGFVKNNIAYLNDFLGLFSIEIKPNKPTCLNCGGFSYKRKWVINNSSRNSFKRFSWIVQNIEASKQVFDCKGRRLRSDNYSFTEAFNVDKGYLIDDLDTWKTCEEEMCTQGYGYVKGVAMFYNSDVAHKWMRDATHPSSGLPFTPNPPGTPNLGNPDSSTHFPHPFY